MPNYATEYEYYRTSVVHDDTVSYVFIDTLNDGVRIAATLPFEKYYGFSVRQVVRKIYYKPTFCSIIIDMEVNQEVIAHLAKLSNFSLDAAESDRLESDLRGIINYISDLDQLNTDGVEPTYQVFEMENVWRADEIQPQEADREALLALTAESQDHNIKVPKVL